LSTGILYVSVNGVHHVATVYNKYVEVTNQEHDVSESKLDIHL